MKYTARILIPLLISLALHSGTAVSALLNVETLKNPIPTAEITGTAHMPDVPTILPKAVSSVTGGTEEQQKLVAWALERYESAGLDLPVLEFHLHDDKSSCKGNSGLFSRSSSSWGISLCTEDRMVFLHEIGHAWAEHTLIDSQRAEYVEHQSMESWNDPETPWRSRGSEEAANTLAWGLLDDPIRGIAPDGPLAQKNEAFRLLTGVYSPRITE